jgi:hypothetical protein
MRLKHYITALLLVVAITFTPALVHAQLADPGDDPDEPTEVPFDGGISILVAAGVAYGLKKKYDAKKELEEE